MCASIAVFASKSSTTATQEKLLTEAQMMIPDTRQRLAAAFSELQSYLVSATHRHGRVKTTSSVLCAVVQALH
jgi:type VI protein secretion system component VasF